MTTGEPNLTRLTGPLLHLMPKFTVPEQELAVALYRELAAGEPVPPERLARRLGWSARETVDRLEGERIKCLVYYDDTSRVTGFGGLAIVPMHHQLEVKGRTLYTWCAWDSLFIPAILDERARVASRCPQTGTMVRLTVTPERVDAVDPESTHLSFLLLDIALTELDVVGTITSFCQRIFFLASSEAGAEWTGRHNGTFLLTVEEAFELGRRKNAMQFGEVLHVPGGSDR